MLAIGILVENAFPGRALVYGDISRVQAEKVVPWAEAPGARASDAQGGRV